jgi:hypothetical protein
MNGLTCGPLSKPVAQDSGDAGSPGRAYGATVALDLVIDRVREAPGKHPMEPPNLDVDARVERQRVDIGKKRVEE